jgi:hypothetical protein
MTSSGGAPPVHNIVVKSAYIVVVARPSQTRSPLDPESVAETREASGWSQWSDPTLTLAAPHYGLRYGCVPDTGNLQRLRGRPPLVSPLKSCMRRSFTAVTRGFKLPYGVLSPLTRKKIVSRISSARPPTQHFHELPRLASLVFHVFVGRVPDKCKTCLLVSSR